MKLLECDRCGLIMAGKPGPDWGVLRMDDTRSDLCPDCSIELYAWLKTKPKAVKR